MISVIIPSYNRAKTIVESVQSVLQQTYTDIEVIVVDDGSTDDTETLLQEISDKRLRYIYQKNAGACSARNKGIQHAKGDLIAFHDSDDIWHEDKLQKQFQKLKTTSADIVICKLNQIVNGKVINKLPSQINEGFVDFKTSLVGVGTQTILGKKGVFLDEMFCNEMPRLQDLELMIRLVKKYNIYCIDEGLVDYYIGSDSITSNPEKLYVACNKLLSFYPNLKKDNPNLINDLVNMMKSDLKRYIVSGGSDYLKYSQWIVSVQKSFKNFFLYILSIMKIYPLLINRLYKEK